MFFKAFEANLFEQSSTSTNPGAEITRECTYPSLVLSSDHSGIQVLIYLCLSCPNLSGSATCIRYPNMYTCSFESFFWVIVRVKINMKVDDNNLVLTP